MAFELRKEREFELGLSYQGPTAVLEFEFNFFFPRGADDLALILDVALFSIDVLPEIQGNYLFYTIESDREPFPDRYRVRITLAGEVEESQGELGPFFPFSHARRPQAVFAIPPLLVIVGAVGLALFFTVIAWRTFKGGLWGGAFGGSGLPAPWSTAVALGAIGLGLYFVFGRGRIRNA